MTAVPPPARRFYTSQDSQVVDMNDDPDFATEPVAVDIDGLLYQPADEFAVARDPDKGAIILMLREDQRMVVYVTAAMQRDLIAEFTRIADSIESEAETLAREALERAGRIS